MTLRFGAPFPRLNDSRIEDRMQCAHRRRARMLRRLRFQTLDSENVRTKRGMSHEGRACSAVVAEGKAVLALARAAPQYHVICFA
ncbi:hypothetical protein Mapa_013618 [Marchantia paleacea]|nr:hypothetical protein Mapa_013618 [Marchantia paleacea]